MITALPELLEILQVSADRCAFWTFRVNNATRGCFVCFLALLRALEPLRLRNATLDLFA